MPQFLDPFPPLPNSIVPARMPAYIGPAYIGPAYIGPVALLELGRDLHMDQRDLPALIERIADARLRLFPALAVPGAAHWPSISVLRANNTLVGFEELAAPAKQAEWLGSGIDRRDSPRAARALASAAFHRVREALHTSEPQGAAHACGVGCVIAPHQGEGSETDNDPAEQVARIHLAAHTLHATTTVTLELPLGEMASVEQLTSRAESLWLDLLRELAGRSDGNEYCARGRERMLRRVDHAPPEWQRVMSGEEPAVLIGNRPKRRATRRLIFPGAFAPLHAGHRELAHAAQRIGRGSVELELSLFNVDKPPVDYTDLAWRLSHVDRSRLLWISRASTFVDKSQLFPGTTFVVGADTVARIGDAVYYGGDATARDAAVEAIAGNECRFLVFGRLLADRFIGLDEIDLPARLRELCEGVPETDFRCDISSTEIRARRALSL